MSVPQPESLVEQIRIVCVDDLPMIRSALIALIEKDAQMQVVGEASNGLEAVAMALKLRPDIVLMDLRMPVMDGPTATRTLLRTWPEAKVLMLTLYDSIDDIDRALKAGAKGYLLKGAQAQELHRSLREVYVGQEYLSPDVTQRRNSGRPVALTNRELEILQLIAREALSNEAIAERLKVAVSTVKFHVGNILEKLEANDRVGAIAEAMRRGLV